MDKRLLALFFFLVLLLASEEVVVETEAYRVCSARSKYFRGACKEDHICAVVCRDEAFSGGRCKGRRDRHHCVCTKLC